MSAYVKKFAMNVGVYVVHTFHSVMRNSVFYAIEYVALTSPRMKRQHISLSHMHVLFRVTLLKPM